MLVEASPLKYVGIQLQIVGDMRIHIQYCKSTNGAYFLMKAQE